MIPRVRIILLNLLIPICLNAFAGGNDTIKGSSARKIHPMIELGAGAGGQVTDGLLIYKTSKSIEASINLKSQEKVFYGLGAGFETYNKDSYVPLFVHLKGITKKDKSSAFLSVQAGYGFLSSSSTYRLLDIRSQGGVFFSPGVGYQLRLDKYRIMLGVNYKHQFVNERYSVFSERIYRNEANIHMLSFKAGFLFD